MVNTNNNDIDALLDALTPYASGFGDVEMYRADALRYHAAITALVADRDELKARVENLKAVNGTYASIVSERDGLRKRVVELDALKQRIADLESDNRALGYNNATLRGLLKSHPPADRDRELRERLICTALEGACSQDGWVSQEAIANHVVGIANATLAAMRKEGGGA